jgi:hypothetical protein
MHPPRPIKPFWTLTALVVLVQLLMVQAMAASGALHKRCHDHADEDGHQCAVTMLLTGGYDTVAPRVVLIGRQAAAPPPAAVAVPRPVDAAPPHLRGGVLAHAPPRGP